MRTRHQLTSSIVCLRKSILPRAIMKLKTTSLFRRCFLILGTWLALMVLVAVPGHASTNILQLFYAGSDATVRSMWRNPDGSWSGEQKLWGFVSCGCITAAQVPGTNFLQIFYTDSGTVGSMWRNPDGSWSGEQNLGGSVDQGSVFGYITAPQVPGTNYLQIFYSGPDTTVRSRWRNPDGSWSYELNLGGSGAYSNIATVVVP